MERLNVGDCMRAAVFNFRYTSLNRLGQFYIVLYAVVRSRAVGRLWRIQSASSSNATHEQQDYGQVSPKSAAA
eukprot:2725219-Pleurochrysis_carterae.AAC.1